MPTPQEVLERLKSVRYPGFTRDVVSFGLIRDIEVASDGVTVHIAPTTARDEVVAEIEAGIRAAVAAMPDVAAVQFVREQPPPSPRPLVP